MAGTATQNVVVPNISHEDWCKPTGERTAIRLESFTALSDDPATGRTVPAKRVTRCLECGNARYDSI